MKRDYQFLTDKEARLVKSFLLHTPLERPIHLEFPDAGLGISVAHISEPEYESRFYDMETRRFEGPGGTRPLSLGAKRGYLEMHIGRWGDAARLEASHVVLGSDLLDERFGQVELSTCLSDGGTVYLTKNLTKHGRDGAIVRLNAGADRAEQVRRRHRLVEALDATTIFWNDTEYLVVMALPKDEMMRRPKQLFWEFMLGFLRYAGEVECLRKSHSANDAFVGWRTRKGSYRYVLPREDRDRIERAAMREARRILTDEGFEVTDISSRNIGCDLVARKRGRTLWVEVKGTTTPGPQVEMTANEHNLAEERGPDYELLIVCFDDTDAVTVRDAISLRDPIRNAKCVISPVRFSVALNR